MKQFNTLAQLAAAKVLTGTPVRVLEPALIDGVMEATGEGLTLPSGNVFVPKFDDQEALTGRKTSLLADEFSSSLTTYLNLYSKNDDGEWITSDTGRTSNVYYAGQLWTPVDELPIVSGGYRVISWSLNSGILEVLTDQSVIVSFNRYTGFAESNLKYVAVANNVKLDEVAYLAEATVSGILYFYDNMSELTYVADTPISGTITAIGADVSGSIQLTVSGSTKVISLKKEGQYLPYRNGRTYLPNETCTTINASTGAVEKWLSYSTAPNTGHDPQNPANRHDAWASFPTPCWWIKDHGMEPGTPAYWFSNDIPENALQVMDTDINAAFYHRIAKAYPALVSGSNINLADILGRYIRIAQGTTYKVNTTHEDAIRNITGYANTGSQTFDSTASGAMYKVNVNSMRNSGGDNEGDSVRIMFDASRQVATASENMPKSTMANLIIFI